MAMTVVHIHLCHSLVGGVTKTYIVNVNVKIILSTPSGLFGDNLQHWLGDFARLLTVQFTSNDGMSNNAPIHECESEIEHYTGHYVPCSLQRVCGFFNVPQKFLLQVQGLVRRALRFIVLILED